MAEIGLPRLRAERGEFGTIESHNIFSFRMLVLESLEHFRAIVGGIFHPLVTKERYPFKFLISSHIANLQNFSRKIENLGNLGFLGNLELNRESRGSRGSRKNSSFSIINKC